MIKIIRFLFHYSPRAMVWAAVTAVLAGACNAGLIALVNAVLSGAMQPETILITGFMVLCVVRLLANYLSQVSLTRFAQQSTAKLRRELVHKIIGVPLRQLEEVGPARLMVALTEDVNTLTQAMCTIPAFIVNFSVLLGGAVYLGFLSIKVLMMVAVLIVIGCIGYSILIHSGFSLLRAAREAEDRLFTHFRSLTEGIKELKLNRNRRELLIKNEVVTSTEDYMRNNIAAEIRFILGQNWSQFLFFTLIGLILFLMPKMQGLSIHAMTGYIVVTLYLMGPLSALMYVLPVFGRAKVALSKIEKIGLTLTEQGGDLIASVPNSPPLVFNRLEFTNITHSYRRENEDSTFTLGPLNLAFAPSEIVFIVGGNGSGKSTLAKIITGLYSPAQGEIRLNGKLIDDHNRDHYRQLFSAVFADFYLFDTLLSSDRTQFNARANNYLARLQLDHKVKIVAGVLSTTELSQGQRKRLALLSAYMEDRPFYLFDEWASDQDPLFKEVFYSVLLPELRANKKAVLVISHDDRYFHMANRLIKLDCGQFVETQPEAKSTTPLARIDLVSEGSH